MDVTMKHHNMMATTSAGSLGPMDHSKMNMDANMNDNMNMNMMMYFHVSSSVYVLFQGWHVTTPLGMFFSCLAVFLFGFVYEGLKLWRRVVLHSMLKTNKKAVSRGGRTNALLEGEGEAAATTEETVAACPSSETCRRQGALMGRMFNRAHVVQCLFHFIQTTWSYLLMLLFMTFNVWICLATVLGITGGYFVFGWRDPLLFMDKFETCH